MPPPFIHPLAHMADGVIVGNGTKIWQFASCTGGTILGQDCVVWPFAMLDGPHFGDRCKIASGVAMGAGFLIGNDVFIGPNVTFCNDMWPRVDRDGYDERRLRLGIDYSIVIEDGVSIGANAVILPGVRIGKGTMIGAGTVLNRSIGAGLVALPDGKDMIIQHRSEYSETRMRWVK